MSKNSVSIEIAPEVITQLEEKLKEIKELLAPFSVKLTASARMGIPKMSDKTVAFVGKVADYVDSNPLLVPPIMETEEFKKDYKANQALQPIYATSEQINEMLRDILILTGSEAYSQALLYYASVKMAAKVGNSEAKTIQEDLGKRFPKGSKSSKESTQS
ncbi:hypothetical protein [Capnocytophaga catalasegens]|uniref:Uncharacterized protein n=1 Tax=Capnocytophaga catalasegens TaxID=1004260 RepID=A0AAV5AYJ7_9FLAO|nr:hypothetical protein [Capnocytophaga catalasegens]GIZ15473.1 hypothetical protein RCZ03_14730 [Capnocytophaga catalasegens]GJM51061.1 hypothetical protein RCZ15_20340 [Capnocytophaga catalasegens]GJM52246.1 hypothetical protein RCZ16_05640 [Capnocytophaga catalasegens]